MSGLGWPCSGFTLLLVAVLSLIRSLNMSEYGTWKSEPASEDAWEVDWSIAEPDPEYVEREAYREMYQSTNQASIV